MRVIVTIEVGIQGRWATGWSNQHNISVRKCPPNYITKESEYIIEVDDYTDDDIKEYFEKPGIEWRGWKKKKKGHVK